jgi:hypothetical protein
MALKQSEYTLEQIYTLLKDSKNNLQTKIPYSHLVKTNGKVLNLSIGRVWFNLLLPDDYKLINQPIAKKELSNVLADIAMKYDTTIASKTLSTINKEGFYLGTLIPTSFSPESFEIPPEIEKRRAELLNPDLPAEQFVSNITKLGNEYLEWLRVNNDGLYDIVKSGAKSNPTEIGVILFAKGPVVGIDGKISKPILGSVNRGFELEDWYKSSDQSRSVLFIRAIATAEPGALAREVFYANANTQLDYKSDCKTKKYLELLITPSIRNVINGRFYLDEKTSNLVKIDDDTEITGKTVKLRSPIYCKQKDSNICSVCYGDLGEKLQTRNVGLLAGSIINVVGVNNYSMKARHNASQVQIRPANMITDMIRA